MKEFAQLFYDLDQTNKTNEKIQILVDYLRVASELDKMWMISLFMGKRPKRVINSTKLREYAAETAGIPLWLFEECYSTIGDLSETISLLIPETLEKQDYDLAYYIQTIIDMAKQDETSRKKVLINTWQSMGKVERFVFNKLTSSTFRVGVSQNNITKALALYTGISQAILTHKLMGNWDVNNISFYDLFLNTENQKDISQPYPFALAYSLEDELTDLGNPKDWQAEWKWDGIRSQLIKREGTIFIWSRGEELITEKFPEFGLLINSIPDGIVIDGEILPFKEEKVLSFNQLQTRIGRKNLNAKILEEVPVIIFAYDLLEYEGIDFRKQPLSRRREILSEIILEKGLNPLIRLSPNVDFETWESLPEKREFSRENSSEGLMLKKIDSVYQVGRKKGNWWKWKVDPFTIDGVLIYAQSGSGRRANLYTDFTFGVWQENRLVTFAKAYSGLTDKEIAEVDAWIKKNTIEKYGPVRTVKPELVFELGFEGIAESKRHKSGVAVRFPRILRWRKDKKIEEADTLEGLRKLLHETPKQRIE